MDIRELSRYGFQESVIHILEERGIQKLNPVQEAALKTKFLENNANLVVASPTASGKTLITELAALNMIQQGKKVAYTCPLRALASEHYDTFKKYKKTGINIALSIGDYDSSDPWLSKYDLVLTTNEKLDSLFRHRSKFIPNIGLLVIDEVHLLDTNRGPTLETIITRFKQLFPQVQIVALSATIPNAEELADWLDAELVHKNWRPTKLVQGVYCQPILETDEGTREIESSLKTPVAQLCNDTLSRGGEALVFVNTRRSAEAEAERLKPVTSKHCDAKKLEKLSENILNSLETPTRQCRRLADCVKNGVAFHHAGLVQKQRKLIEDAFRKETIKVISATPTLAMGINTPADTVIIRDVTRYTSRGLVHINVGEYQQLAGRAGRPNYGKDGLAIILARDEGQRYDYMDRYVHGEPEQIKSKMGFEPVLRTQLLASIALHFTPSQEKLDEFLMHSFYAHTYGEIDSLRHQIRRILQELDEMGFIEIGDELMATELGKRVTELYLDPFSAHTLLSGVEREMEELGWLYLITSTEELKPYLHVKVKEESKMWNSANSLEKELGIDTVNLDYSEYDFLEKFKSSLLLRDWINEKTDETILEEYGIAPGILRTRISNAEWISYAGEELCKIVGVSGSGFRKMRRRLKYGVKAELLPLIGLRGIGRIRARKLFQASIKKTSDLEKVPLEDLSRILGLKTAVSIKKQLGQEVSTEVLKEMPSGSSSQTTMSAFS
ncbi:DEAD/DEAH box helicase [archaeon]|nr:DEAD/DEAH box helicase [archaeon]